jgi:hypothetical protein
MPNRIFAAAFGYTSSASKGKKYYSHRRVSRKYIVLNVASKMEIKNLKVVMMGGCWTNTYKEYLPIPLYGKFLSIIEITDSHGTCNQILRT